MIDKMITFMPNRKPGRKRKVCKALEKDIPQYQEKRI